MAKRRSNIGLLVATITDEFSNRVAIGAMEAAKQLDADLIIFPGKYVGVQHINEMHNAKYEYQYNVLFDHAAEAKLDYLIVAVGTIAYAYDNARRKEFLDNLGDTPILSVASEIEGYDFLQFDNRTGVAEAVEYLAKQGRKHIGIMAGILENNECLQRFEMYRKALGNNGLEFKDSYVMPCNLFEECRDEAEELIDKNPELDAVICANDIVASVLYEVLKERGLRVGIDVAVVGFDDLPLASRLDPPLATVKADAVMLGKRAVEKAVNYLNGVADDCHYIGSQFIPRPSCGKNMAGMDLIGMLSCDGLSDMIGKIRNSYPKTEENSPLTEERYDQLAELLEHLERSYINDSADVKTVEETAAVLERMGRHGRDSVIGRILYGAYIMLLRSAPVRNVPYIEMLKSYFPEYKEDRDSAETAESVTNKFMERSHIDNIFVRDALMFGGNLKDSYADIMKRLVNVGAVTGFIYIFDKPMIHRCDDSFPRDLTWYFKSYSYGANVFTVPEAEQKMSAPEVFDNKYLCTERQHIFIVADLYSAEMQYGIALLEPKDKEFFEELELVTYQLSSAVRTLDILRKQETLLDEINTRNLALDRMSKIDELTMVFNRRGFYPAAEERINAAENRGKPFIVCYADMDGLKIVNDTYGHTEGDNSIRLVAECLSHIFGDGAVVGRMGGDEFAAIVPASEDMTVEALTYRKEQFINSFNDSGEKPYRFGVSMGMLECVCDNSYDLRAALDKADDLLYAEKSCKKKKRDN